MKSIGNKKGMVFVTTCVFFLLFGGIMTWLNKEEETVTEEAYIDTSSSVTEETEKINDTFSENDRQKDKEERERESIREEIQAAVSSIVKSARGLFIQQNLHITAVGDSLTQGVGDESKNGGYVGILEKMMGEANPDASFEIENHGKRGRRTDHLITRLENDEEMNRSLEEADIILLTIGANDIMKIVRNNFDNLTYDVFAAEIDEYEDRLYTLFDAIRKRNDEASLYLIGVFNPFHMYFDYIPELNQIVDDWNDVGQRAVERDGHGEFIPVDDLFLEADNTYFSDDNFHPNQQGYAIIGERIFEYIEPEITTDFPPTIEGEQENDNN